MNYTTIACAGLLLLASCKKDTAPKTTVDGPTAGTIFVSPNGLTDAGQLWQLNEDGTTSAVQTVPASAFNFQKWEVNGQTRYTYLEFDNASPIILYNAITPCSGVVLDANFNEIDRVRLLPFNGRTASDPSAIDSHEFVYLADGHYITLSYYQKTVNNIPASLGPVAGCSVVAPIIQEVQNGAVVWEWDGSDYPEFYTHSVEGNDFGNAASVHDYIHLNSITVDPRDGNLICSMRHLDQVVKIRRNTGEIVWRLGGQGSDFPITADNKFLRQHHATLTDDNRTLLLYDNGQRQERPYSRVAEFVLDEGAHTIASYKNYNVPGNVFSEYMGSVQKRGSTYFIGCGSVPKIIEVDYTTNRVTFSMDLPKASYRAFKY